MIQDLRFAWRTLRRTPGFAALVVLILGLGIGATTTVFSIANAVLLRPLPFAEVDRLYSLFENTESGARRLPSYPAFSEWRQQASVFSDISYVRGEDFVIRGEEGPQRVTAAYVAGDFFRLLGARPLLGRVFSDEGPGQAPVVVLSNSFWREHFGGDPTVIGRLISTTDGSFTVVGVMPSELAVPLWWARADVWAPIGAIPPARAYALTQWNLHVDAHVLARLRPGVSPEGAEAEMSQIARRLSQTGPAEQQEWTRVSLLPVPEQALGGVGAQLLILTVAVALVLVIACVNVANLLLAKASAGSGIIAVQAALGARRGRLVRQLLTESLLLSLGGGALGVLFTVGAVGLLRAGAGSALPRLDQASVDGRVLGFALVLSVAVTLLFGLLPALRAASGDLLLPLRSGTPGSGTHRGAVRLRATLVVAQIALAMALLVGSGLLIKSLWRLQEVELGFNPEGVVLLRVIPPLPRYRDGEAAAELYRRLREAVAAVQGVQVALANHIPLAGGWVPTRVDTGNDPPPDGRDQALYRTVSPEYFSAMQLKLLRGRTLTSKDMAVGGGVVINETMAGRFWPDRDPIGEHVTVFKSAQERPDLGEPITAQVVGIVGDEKFFDLTNDPSPAVFLPYTWNPWGAMYLVIETRGAPPGVLPALRRAVLSVDADIPVAGPGIETRFHTMDEYLMMSLAQQRLNTRVLSVFAASAFTLALIGIYGVMAYVVIQRTREIGLRMALGSSPRLVLGLLIRQALMLAGAGIVLGGAAALVGTRLLRSQLYEVSETDPLVLFTVALTFTIAALAAAIVPLRRASRVDPMVVLRAE